MRTVLILMDTLRRDFLRCYGNDWTHTPNIDRLAEEGVVFDNHYVGSLPCMPARVDLFTGRLNFLHRGWSGSEPFDRHLPELLRVQGVHSHMCTDHYHYFHAGGENLVDHFSSWDFQRGQEGDKWVGLVDRPALPECDYPTKLRPQYLANRSRMCHDEEFSTPRSCMDAVRWIDDNAHADDWFLQVEVFDPHEPFDCPREYLDRYGDDWDGNPWIWPAYDRYDTSPEARIHMQRRYAALMTMADRWVGRVIERLRVQGVLEETMVILTTDHGTMLGDRGGYWMKNYMPVWNELANIPLIVRMPGGAGGGIRSEVLTQTPDLNATICHHHGVEADEHSHGKAIQDMLAGRDRHECVIYGYFGQAVNCTDGRYVYMREQVSDEAGIHAYYAQPIRQVMGGDPQRGRYDDLEGGFRFPWSRGYPLTRIPAGSVSLAKRREALADVGGSHVLYDLHADPGQTRAVEDRERETEMCEHIRGWLRRLHAPEEQFARLDL